jgi:hypothetical protein
MNREIIKVLQKQTGLIVEIWADKFNPEYFTLLEDGVIVENKEQIIENEEATLEEPKKRIRRTKEQIERDKANEELAKQINLEDLNNQILN